ncbi:MAG: signal peptidase II [Kiritimatiellae bacterium]|nr:signal peptidase II [Kiritimatiellia bacterium]
MRKFILATVAVLHLLILDAVTKELAAGYLKGSPGRSVIDGLLDFSYVENRGCAWGMLQGHVWPLAVFGMLAIAFIAWKRRDLFYPGSSTGRRLAAGAWAECLLYAGITGNLIDRVFRGGVIDFIDVHWGNAWHFPCFNMADIYITFAAGLLILLSVSGEKEKESKEEKSAKAAPGQ